MIKFLFVFWLLSAGLAGAAVFTGKVIAISDGDTITVLSPQNEQFKVRLVAIDAPEKAQPFGTRAKQKLSDVLFQKPVTVEWNKRDRYQRIVGKVMVFGQDAGLLLIESGFAWHYKQYQQEQSATDRARYERAESTARRDRLGLWAAVNSIPPWEWRKGKFGN